MEKSFCKDSRRLPGIVARSSRQRRNCDAVAFKGAGQAGFVNYVPVDVDLFYFCNRPFWKNLRVICCLLSCIIKKRLLIALSIAVGIAILAYIFSLKVGVRDAAFPAVVGIAILAYAVSKPAWLIVERVATSDYRRTPLLAISHADDEYYASLVEALRKAEEVYMARPETKNPSLSRIHKNEAYKILSFLRSQNADRSSKEFYVEYDGRAYHAILQFQYERPKLVD